MHRERDQFGSLEESQLRPRLLVVVGIGLLLLETSAAPAHREGQERQGQGAVRTQNAHFRLVYFELAVGWGRVCPGFLMGPWGWVTWAI